MSRSIMLLDQLNGKLLGPDRSLALFGRKISPRRQLANVRKVLLKLLLGLAFHELSP